MPFMAGANRPKTLVGPLCEYCPKATSRKNSGSPMRKSMMVYGIRKVPPPFSYAWVVITYFFHFKYT